MCVPSPKEEVLLLQQILTIWCMAIQGAVGSATPTDFEENSFCIDDFCTKILMIIVFWAYLEICTLSFKILTRSLLYTARKIYCPPLKNCDPFYFTPRHPPHPRPQPQTPYKRNGAWYLPFFLGYLGSSIPSQFHTVVQLKRSTSSILTGVHNTSQTTVSKKPEFNLSRFLVTNKKKAGMVSSILC